MLERRKDVVPQQVTLFFTRLSIVSDGSSKNKRETFILYIHQRHLSTISISIFIRNRPAAEAVGVSGTSVRVRHYRLILPALACLQHNCCCWIGVVSQSPRASNAVALTTFNCCNSSASKSTHFASGSQLNFRGDMPLLVRILRQEFSSQLSQRLFVVDESI